MRHLLSFKVEEGVPGLWGSKALHKRPKSGVTGVTSSVSLLSLSLLCNTENLGDL
jgi:hypothetical protein